MEKCKLLSQGNSKKKSDDDDHFVENVEKVECEVCSRQLTSFVNNELVDGLKTLEG